MKHTLTVLKDVYAICQLNSNSEIPGWIKDSDFYSFTRTKDEVSIVCKQSAIQGSKNKTNKNWRILKIMGPLDFSLIGIIAEISAILKKHKISVFVISTYETDYIMVKNSDLNKAIVALKNDGHKIILND